MIVTEIIPMSCLKFCENQQSFCMYVQWVSWGEEAPRLYPDLLLRNKSGLGGGRVNSKAGFIAQQQVRILQEA